jgi:hypothetical protein
MQLFKHTFDLAHLLINQHRAHQLHHFRCKCPFYLYLLQACDKEPLPKSILDVLTFDLLLQVRNVLKQFARLFLLPIADDILLLLVVRMNMLAHRPDQFSLAE